MAGLDEVLRPAQDLTGDNEGEILVGIIQALADTYGAAHEVPLDRDEAARAVGGTIGWAIKLLLPPDAYRLVVRVMRSSDAIADLVRRVDQAACTDLLVGGTPLRMPQGSLTLQQVQAAQDRASAIARRQLAVDEWGRRLMEEQLNHLLTSTAAPPQVAIDDFASFSNWLRRKEGL